MNTLGWPRLRPLQEAAIGPILADEHVLLVAPTAGGKTEAAVLPLLSRMLSEPWSGLTVLYLCPLRALLNNLEVRISSYAELVGRRAAIWHGDVGPAGREAIVREPPDILLTTPESLEAMLIGSRVEQDVFFRSVRTVVIDEAHAFAADDRGWHLLAVLERISRLAGRELQRLALSATVGNPDDLLGWLTTTCHRSTRIVAPEPPDVPAAGSTPSAAPSLHALHASPSPVGQLSDRPEVTVDYVGSLDNAALVISRLNRGEKRLVFADSRSSVERLTIRLRELGVTTFVSHGSLGREERRAAEAAFTEGRDCVIVATSTLELGIDVGDLDRVIQIDAPSTVASFLQRLGRTGRRSGVQRSALFLATSQEAFLLCLGLLYQWSQGFVEPVRPPALPLHLAAQQLLALCLQERGIGRRLWTEWLGDPFVLGEEAAGELEVIVEHLLGTGIVYDDGGMLAIGIEGDALFGRQHFLELTSAFTSAPVFSVRHGRDEIGTVPDAALTMRPPGTSAGGPPVLLLAGRSWLVRHVDWRRRVVDVEPTDAPGIARWFGGSQHMSAVLAAGIHAVLLGSDPSGITLSKRANEKLAEVHDELAWIRSAGPDTAVLRRDEQGRVRWWTFAGYLANAWLAAGLTELRRDVGTIDNLTIGLDPDVDLLRLTDAIATIDLATVTLADRIVTEAIDGLKFSACLPDHLALRVVEQRLDDRASAERVLSSRVVASHHA